MAGSECAHVVCLEIRQYAYGMPSRQLVHGVWAVMIVTLQ